MISFKVNGMNEIEKQIYRFRELNEVKLYVDVVRQIQLMGKGARDGGENAIRCCSGWNERRAYEEDEEKYVNYNMLVEENLKSCKTI